MEIRAAGGLLTRRGGGQLEVLVIHRPKYDDWSFPKGKPYAGETDEACALREVEEETGFLCKLDTHVDDVRYQDSKGRAKVVRYFSMTPLSGEFVASEEVDETRWLSTEDARALLSYEHDRALLDLLEHDRGR